MQGLRLGTRGSALALAQARKVAAAIETAQRWPDGWVQIVEIKTTGDKVQDRPLAEIGGKGLWTKELDRALLDGEVDFCVHSMKDVESVRPDEIHIAAVRPRGDVRDRLIGAASIDELKEGLAPELGDELDRLIDPFSDATPSESELRIAQAQLVGWLEGLFHGIQTAIYAQQMAARAQLEQMRRALPPGAMPAQAGLNDDGDTPGRGDHSSGMYL